MASGSHSVGLFPRVTGITCFHLIDGLKTPLLVIHGERDRLIPISEGRALFAAAPEPKAWYPIPGAGHNDTYLTGGDAYFHRLAAFASDLSEGYSVK